MPGVVCLSGSRLLLTQQNQLGNRVLTHPYYGVLTEFPAQNARLLKIEPQHEETFLWRPAFTRVRTRPVDNLVRVGNIFIQPIVKRRARRAV